MFYMSKHAMPAEDSSYLAFLDWLFRRVSLALGYRKGWFGIQAKDGYILCLIISGPQHAN